MPIGPLMLDIAGKSLTPEDVALLQNPQVGGVILFSRNYHNPDQLQQLVFAIRQCRNEPILIAVDQEGGRIQRFTDGFSLLPACSKYGEVYDKNPQKGIQLAQTGGWLMAAELLALGIDLSFAPVLDLNYGISEVIGNRSFHQQPEIVAILSHSFIYGMHQAGMQATGKHFPGHGAVAADSHVAIPVDERPMESIWNADIIPFENLIANDLAGIMPAHVIYPQLDSLPAGFSHYWLQQVLRSELNFNGVIFSDDLLMQGAAVIGDVKTRAKKALEAGCDMILVCNDSDAQIEVLNNLEGYKNPQSQQRLLKMCGHFKMSRHELKQSNEWQNARKILLELSSEKEV